LGITNGFLHPQIHYATPRQDSTRHRRHTRHRGRHRHRIRQEGADVAISARHDGDDAQHTKRAIEALGHRCEIITADCGVAAIADNSSPSTVRALGRLDVLVHAAGGAGAGRPARSDYLRRGTRRSMCMSTPSITLRERPVPHLRQGKDGAIVLISSTAGKLGVMGNHRVPGGEGALPHLTRALARELANDNIRVNCVAPGVIRTKFHEHMSAEQKKLNLEQRIPLHREGTPEQVASVIWMLATNDYITGDTVTIDGGLTSRIA
jgi:NAD(P)-dependent dehydrogenase (short-subunit alcohol dehydrogenase family)